MSSKFVRVALKAMIVGVFCASLGGLAACTDVQAEKEAKKASLLTKRAAAIADWGVKQEAWNEVRGKLEKVNRYLQPAKKSKNESVIAEYQPQFDKLAPAFTAAQQAMDEARRKHYDIEAELEDLGWEPPKK